MAHSSWCSWFAGTLAQVRCGTVISQVKISTNHHWTAGHVWKTRLSGFLPELFRGVEAYTMGTGVMEVGLLVISSK